jgi:hypothetical protein
VRPLWIFRFRNSSGTTKWYTDALGNNHSKTPFPGFIEQYISLSPTELGPDWNVDEVTAEKIMNSGVRLPN